MTDPQNQSEHWLPILMGALLAIGAAVKAWPGVKWAWKAATSCIMLIPTMLQAPYILHRHFTAGRGGVLDMVVEMKERQIASEESQAVTRATVERMSGYQEAMIDLGEDGWWFSDLAGSCLRPSAGLCKIVGRNTHEMTGSEWHNAIHPEDRDAVAIAWTDAVRYGRAYERRQRFQRPDGTVVICDVKAATIHAPGGKVTGWVGRAVVVKSIA